MSKVETLLQEINDTLEDTANSLQPSHHRDFIGLDSTLAALVDAVREDERNRIRDEGEIVKENCPLESGRFISRGISIGGEVLVYADCDLRIIPEAVLSPEEEEDDDGNS